MSFLTILMLALGLSMDTLAISLAIGASAKRVTLLSLLGSGLLVASVASAMTCGGWMVARACSGSILAEQQWLGGFALACIGIYMIAGADVGEDADSPPPPSLTMTGQSLLLIALATNCDSFFVGAALAWHKAAIAPLAGTIAAVTTITCIGGIVVGFRLRSAMGCSAEIAGGTVLVGIGGWGFWF